MLQKKCTKCETTQPIDMFKPKNKNDISKRTSWCKSCMNEYAKLYRQKLNYPVNVTEKKCFHCHETKSYTEFSVCNKDTTGLTTLCKSCTRVNRCIFMKDVNNFLLYFKNSIFVTVIATIITLIINSMAAYALSIYEFRGKNIALVFVIGTLLIPLTIILVPVFYVIANFGMINSLWGVILPGAATPTGVFLLRQYMLTLPRELIEAARMDHASEWAIYWRIVLPLSIPAIAVLAIFSIMWRWNDFLWPLIVLSKSEVYTLQIALNAFHGELTSQWNYVLAMTMVTLLPIALIFTYLQKFITTGIASTGMK